MKWIFFDKYFQLKKFHDYDIKLLRHNVLMNLMDGTTFVFALNFISVTTILPVFIQRLGGNAIAVGAIPVLWTLGLNLPQIFFIHEHFREKLVKPQVLKYSLLFRLSFLFTGLCIFFLFKDLPSSVSVPFALLLIFMIAIIGSTPTPRWYNFFAKTTPVKIRGRMLALRQLLGSSLGILAGSFIILILSTIKYPYNFASLFFATFFFSMFSYFFLRQVKEPEEPVTEEVSIEPVNKYSLVKKILQNDINFRNFLIADALILISLTANGFYAVYAISNFGLPTSYAGSFTIILSGSMALGNLIFGFLGDHFGHKVNLTFVAASSLLANISAIAATNVVTFGIVFFFVAFTLSLQGISRLAFVVELCRDSDRALYVALINTVTAPTVLFGLIAGAMISLFGYTIMFVIYTIISSAAIYWMINRVNDPRGMNK